jgi:hypothetical protein
VVSGRLLGLDAQLVGQFAEPSQGRTHVGEGEVGLDNLEVEPPRRWTGAAPLTMVTACESDGYA